MDSLYDSQSCTNNVNTLVHYAKCVEDNGPAWAVMSGFDFENFNGDFKNLFHGTQGIEQQVLTSVSIVQSLPILAEKLHETSPEYIFYKKLSSKGVTSIGYSSGDHADDEFGPALKHAIPEADLPVGLSTCTDAFTIHDRIRSRSKKYQSKIYRRVNSRCNYSVKYKQEENIYYGLILYYARLENGIGYAIIERLNVVEALNGEIGDFNVELTHIFRCNYSKEQELVHVGDVFKNTIFVFVMSTIYM